MYEDKKLFLSSSSVISLKHAKLIICKLFLHIKNIHTHIDFLLFLNSLYKFKFTTPFKIYETKDVAIRLLDSYLEDDAVMW